MSDTSKSSEILNIPRKAGNARSPGRTLESETERQLRYDAQLIAEKHSIPLLQAMGIAKHRIEAEEQKKRKQQSAQARARSLEQERRHDENKRDTIPKHFTRGPPLAGGLPGLGK